MKRQLQGRLLGNMRTDKNLALRWGTFRPGIWDDDDCAQSARHVAVMTDGRVIDLGEARVNLRHNASPSDFEVYEVVVA